MKTASLTLLFLFGTLLGCRSNCEDGTTPFVFDDAFFNAVFEADASIRSAEMLALNRIHKSFRERLRHRGVAPSSIPGYGAWSRRMQAATELVEAQVLDCRSSRRDGFDVGSVGIIEQAPRLEMTVDACIEETVAFLLSVGFVLPVDPAPEGL